MSCIAGPNAPQAEHSSAAQRNAGWAACPARAGGRMGQPKPAGAGAGLPRRRRSQVAACLLAPTVPWDGRPAPRGGGGGCCLLCKRQDARTRAAARLCACMYVCRSWLTHQAPDAPAPRQHAHQLATAPATSPFPAGSGPAPPPLTCRPDGSPDPSPAMPAPPAAPAAAMLGMPMPMGG